jgi:hypothetical protein
MVHEEAETTRQVAEVRLRMLYSVHTALIVVQELQTDMRESFDDTADTVRLQAQVC